MFRVGLGYDVHQLVEGRPLIIGGIEIPYEKGLLGHSDADVLIHAIMDSILGALALGDIGKHFPDTDMAYKDIDSKILLKRVMEEMKSRDYEIVNVDGTIIAQAPKMAPHIEKMKDVLAPILGIDKNSINIKATTTERLGFEGRQEGITAMAVCSLASVKQGG